ncbi:MAG: IS66 family transposase [Anaerolineae bacterium]
MRLVLAGVSFLHVNGVPADNDAAERSLRPVVVMRKISGGTRSRWQQDAYGFGESPRRLTGEEPQVVSRLPQHARQNGLNATPNSYPVGSA